MKRLLSMPFGLCAPSVPFGMRVLRIGVISCLLGATPLARAQNLDDVRPDAFVCFGESQSLSQGVALSDLEVERDKRLRQLAERQVPEKWRAHWHCVVAELMKHLGDLRAVEQYELAINENPADPGYELLAARYLHVYRGAWSHLPATEQKYMAALEKNVNYAGETQVGATHDATQSWAQRGLSLLYAEDGLPLLPYANKAYPYSNTVKWLPQLSLRATGSFGSDTTDFWDTYDTRKLTGEFQVAQKRLGKTSITSEQIQTMARAPVRYSAYGGLRLRMNQLGTLDISYQRVHFFDSQITLFSSPTKFNDVTLDDIGVRYRRTFNVNPLFDLSLDLSFDRQHRVGVVENHPNFGENYNVYGAQAVITRWFGTDRLTFSGGVGYLALPDTPEVPTDQRARARVVRGAALDYGLYRPFVLPALERGTLSVRRYAHRGMHFVVSGVLDDERFGTLLLRRNSASVAWSFKGYEGWSVLVGASYVWLMTDVFGVRDTSLDNAQVRTELKLARTLVDEDYEPALPKQAVSWSWLSMPIRHDVVVSGPKYFQNIRGGVEATAKLFAPALRGTSFLVDAGADVEYFYNIDKAVVLYHLDLRMGWPPFGPVPAYF
jgi:hypothetical protein